MPPEADARLTLPETVACAKAPLRPTTDTPITSTSASARVDACAWTVIDEVPVNELSNPAFVSPPTSAIGMRMSIATPTPAPPGAVAAASFAAVAATSTATVVEIEPST